jgi:hypothetical protein
LVLNPDARDRTAASPDAGGEHLLYLYGVLAQGSAGAVLVRAGRIPGIEPGEPLFAVEAAGLVAAVSRVPAAVFTEERLNALALDLPRLAPYAVRHEEAVRALARSALVPMTFGAVYRSAAGVAALLEGRGAEFRALLARLEGREEWGLKVIADLPRLLETADRRSEELGRLAAEAAGATPGRAYLIAKKRERLRGQVASRLAEAMVGAILGHLEPLTAEIARDDPGPAQPGTEQLVLKAAFLVERATAGAFRAAIATLEREHATHGLRLELTGPWAPYSFVRDRGGSRG